MCVHKSSRLGAFTAGATCFQRKIVAGVAWSASLNQFLYCPDWEGMRFWTTFQSKQFISFVWMAEANAVWYITTADDRGTTQRPGNLHRPNAGSKASTQYDILAYGNSADRWYKRNISVMDWIDLLTPHLSCQFSVIRWLLSIMPKWFPCQNLYHLL